MDVALGRTFHVQDMPWYRPDIQSPLPRRDSCLLEHWSWPLRRATVKSFALLSVEICGNKTNQDKQQNQKNELTIKLRKYVCLILQKDDKLKTKISHHRVFPVFTHLTHQHVAGTVASNIYKTDWMFEIDRK